MVSSSLLIAFYLFSRAVSWFWRFWFYNPTSCFRGRHPRLMIIPNTFEGKMVALTIGILCVLIDQIVFYLHHLGEWVKGMSKGFWEKMERKPPDPLNRHTNRKRRRRLLSALSIILALPIMIRQGHLNALVSVARSIASNHWTAGDASTMHDLLRETNNQALYHLKTQ